jgi:polysaccharide deacetylase family protein (PEP-CTERM system associated)
VTAGATGTATGIVNAMSVDVEDYFQVSAFDGVVERHHWSSFESRVNRNTDRLLGMLAGAGVRGTFFVLGWVADRFPALVRRIAEAGHELASHGHSHRLVYDLTPREFRSDLGRARQAIESAAGVPVAGFRAPSFSITASSLWALDVLIDEGYVYDSSIFPIVRDRYGLPGAPRHRHEITRPAGSLWEIPPATVRRCGVTLPVAGGGYLRLFPYDWTRRAIRSINEREGQPAVVYLHPWEIDPDQPRIRASALGRFRHYVNLGRTEQRLRQLLADFRFGPISSVRMPGERPTPVSTMPALAPGAYALTPGMTV